MTNITPLAARHSSDLASEESNSRIRAHLHLVTNTAEQFPSRLAWRLAAYAFLNAALSGAPPDVLKQLAEELYRARQKG